ncbi:MAG: putative cobaltochelatase [Anaerolineales bacterium]
MRAIYPFTAVVGQERMKRALVLNAVDTRIGGVLIRGERGTAKSTAARALAALLPEVKTFTDCRFGCHPDRPTTWCTECKEKAENGVERSIEMIPTPFINLPVSATEDRVVGTLDIEKAIQKGERHFEPGVLADANRGLLYIDEVNLLDDHVVDLLLDSAAMGMNIVEREGISFSHPARFILVGTMNPEEGDLRPQLLDRFALSVNIRGIRDTRERVLIMERHLAYEQDPEGFRETWMPKEQELSDKIKRARKLLPHVTYTTKNLVDIANLSTSLHVDGHRSDLVILKTARAHAAFEGRTEITGRDIALAAELAYPHRLKRGPFRETEISAEELSERIEALEGARKEAQEGTGQQDEESLAESKKPEGDKVKKKKAIDAVKEKGGPPPPSAEAGSKEVFESSTADWWEGGEKVEIGETFDPEHIESPLDKLKRKDSGRRSETRSERKRGRYIQARPANGDFRDIAFDATLRAAAPYQKQRQDLKEDRAFAIRPDDIQRKVRVQKTGNLILFVVDASWSMAVAERMRATKGAILSLLTDAYQRRDRVGLVVFQKDRALLVLPPTNSTELATKALADIPIGGKTPLSAGLSLAHDVIRKERISRPESRPLLILLTDGVGNVSMTNLAPQQEAYKIAEQIAEDDIPSLVINMEHQEFDKGLAREIAEHLGATYYNVEDLHAEKIVQTVKGEIGA